MNDKFGLPRLGRRSVVKGLAGSMMLPLVGGLSGPAKADDPVEVVIWQWAPGFESYIEAFNASHPNIHLTQVLTASGAEQVLKMRNALLAGSGGPDVAFCDDAMMQAMYHAGAFKDISTEAGPYADLFIPSFIQASTFDGKLYGLPLDAPPMMQFYREDIFNDYGIKVPETWDEFAAAGETVKSKNPNQFITDALFSNGDWPVAWFWQGGWEGFKLEGETLTIDINNASNKKVADYWQRLLDAKLVAADPGFDTSFFQGCDDGRYVTIMAGSWFPAYAGASANKSLGKWRTAYCPNWQKGDDFTPLWGGAAFGVYSGTQHPAEAFEVVKWLTTESPAKEMWVTKNSLVPTLKELLNSPEMKAAKFAWTGDQPVNEVIFKAVEQVKRPFVWSPFQDVVFTALVEELSAAANGAGTLSQGLDKVQDRIVVFAQDQGFTVA